MDKLNADKYMYEVNCQKPNDKKMDEYEEALRYLKKHRFEMFSGIVDKQLNILQELVERATPKKTIKDGGYEKCPNCNKYLPLKFTNVYKNNCPNCGQALDME